MGPTRNQPRSTRKLSAVARIRFRLWSSMVRTPVRRLERLTGVQQPRGRKVKVYSGRPVPPARPPREPPPPRPAAPSQASVSAKRHRPGGEEALVAVAAELGEHRALRLGLHPLGQGADAERVRHRDHRGGQRPLLLARLDAGDEAAVDLDAVDHEPAQVGDRGVPGAEVVELDVEAGRGEAAQVAHHQVGVALDQHRLEHLDGDAVRLDAEALGLPLDLLDQPRVAELGEREVDADPRHGEARPRPRRPAPRARGSAPARRSAR